MNAAPAKQPARRLSPLARGQLRIGDIELGARMLPLDGGSPAELYLASLGVSARDARLCSGVLLSHPNLASWRGRGGVWPALVFRAVGPHSRALHCTFLTAGGRLAPVAHPRLDLGIADGATALLADPLPGFSELALIAQTADGALQALGQGFAGSILAALTLANMTRVALPAGVDRLRLVFDSRAGAASRAQVAEFWERRRYHVTAGVPQQGSL